MRVERPQQLNASNENRFYFFFIFNFRHKKLCDDSAPERWVGEGGEEVKRREKKKTRQEKRVPKENQRKGSSKSSPGVWENSISTFDSAREARTVAKP